MTFLKAMIANLKLENEDLATFRAQYAQLTDSDKTQLREMFAAEGVAIDA